MANSNDPAVGAKLPLPTGFQGQVVADYWGKQLSEVADVDPVKATPELATETVKERHRIYCYLLMKLICRFWNGNKRGPVGLYPRREKQKQSGQDPNAKVFRYRGDMNVTKDLLRPSWDRYLGHNIACIAVDGHGDVIDFDFNHNDFFRSSAEHAESRMVRRLFSLADISDGWATGRRLPHRTKGFSLQDVTLYTSLESCAQCSGVMSLGRVKQIVYMQHDYMAYMIGNIMYNLAGVDGAKASLAPLPIAASAIDLKQFDELNAAYQTYLTDITDAAKTNDRSRAFWVPLEGDAVDYDPIVTSFLCTDVAYDIIDRGAKQLDTLTLKHGGEKYPGRPHSHTNAECLHEAKRFYEYADVEGFRGSPHKL